MAACQAAGIKFSYDRGTFGRKPGYYPRSSKAFVILDRLARLLGFVNDERYLRALPREKAAIFKRAKLK